MVGLVTPNPGDTILASHIFQLTGLINGVASKGQRVQFTQYSDAANYATTLGNVDATNGLAVKIQYGPAAAPITIATFAKAGISFSVPVTSLAGPLTLTANSTSYDLTLQNTNAGGKALSILSPTGVQFVYAASNGTNNVLSVSDTTVTVVSNSLFLVAKNIGTHYVAADFVMDCTGTGGSAVQDAGALRATTTQQNTNGNSLHRAIEAHARRYAPAILGGTWVHEMNVSSTVAGSGNNSLVGIYLQGGNGTIGEVKNDTGLRISGPAGFDNAILYLDTNLTTELFKVSDTGQVTSGTLMPRASNTYTIGTNGTFWLAVYAGFHVSMTNGSAGGPSWTYGNDLTTGAFLASAGNLGWATSATERIRLTSGGMLDFRDTANQEFANGTTAIVTLGNYGGTGRPTAAAQVGWLKVAIGGVASWLPYWR